MTYQLWKTMEDNLQNLNINDVEELSYNVSDSDLEKHLQGIHDAFKSQEVSSYFWNFLRILKILDFGQLIFVHDLGFQEIGYVPHLLVPPDHLMFTRRNLAKHYLNVDLLHRELIPLINVIDKRIKEYAKLVRTKISTITPLNHHTRITCFNFSVFKRWLLDNFLSYNKY